MESLAASGSMSSRVQLTGIVEEIWRIARKASHGATRRLPSFAVARQLAASMIRTFKVKNVDLLSNVATPKKEERPPQEDVLPAGVSHGLPSLPRA